ARKKRPKDATAPEPKPGPERVAFDPMAFENLEADEPAEAVPPPPPPGETEKEKKKRLEKEAKARQQAAGPKKRWVYLTVPIVEGRPYKLGTVDVAGNTVFSKREVLARFPLRSGMVYNDALVKAATKRMEDDYGERGYFYVSIDPQVSK